MSSLLPIPTILSIADISQYLSANDISQGKKLKSGFLAPLLSVQIFLAKTVVRWMYSLNPSDSTLTQTSNYLFQLLGSYAITAQNILNNVAGGVATISNPANVSINIGQSATFSVTVTSASPYTIAWYRNGVIILGATGLSYTLTNVQLSDTASTFYAVATNATGPIPSGVATLTVTAVILLSAFYTDTDPHSTLLANSDPFAYQFTVSVSHNQPISIPIPQAASNNKFWVFRVVSTEQDDNTWFNTALNNGSIPDSVFWGIIKFGGNSYYSLRNASSFDYTQPLVLSKV